MKETGNISENMLYRLSRLALLTGIGIYYFYNGSLEAIGGSPECSSALYNDSSRQMLFESAAKQKTPLLYQDRFQIIYGCVRKNESCIFTGPMSVQRLSRGELHQYYKEYHMTPETESTPQIFSVVKAVAFISLLANEFLEIRFKDADILSENFLLDNAEKNLKGN